MALDRETDNHFNIFIYRDFGRGGSIGLFGDLRGLRGGLMWVFPLSRKTEIRTGDQEEDEKYRIGRQDVGHQILLQQMTPSMENFSWTVGGDWQLDD